MRNLLCKQDVRSSILLGSTSHPTAASGQPGARSAGHCRCLRSAQAGVIQRAALSSDTFMRCARATRRIRPDLRRVSLLMSSHTTRRRSRAARGRSRPWRRSRATTRPMTPASWAWACRAEMDVAADVRDIHLELRRGVTAYAAELLRWPLGSHLAEVSRSASQPRTAPAGRETARARSVAVLTSCSMRA